MHQIILRKAGPLCKVVAPPLAALLMGTVLSAEPPASKVTADDLTRKLWSPERIESARQAVDQQRTSGLLSEAALAKRKNMLAARQAGTYKSQSLSVEDPPLNFIQNGGFEQTNPNSARNRSRWLWWGGWSWGGDYENMWEERPEYVHSGKLSARIKCTGAKGRIGISTPPLPSVPGVTDYKLTFWAKGEGDNMVFIWSSSISRRAPTARFVRRSQGSGPNTQSWVNRCRASGLTRSISTSSATARFGSTTPRWCP